MSLLLHGRAWCFHKFSFSSSYTLTAATAQVIYQIYHGFRHEFRSDVAGAYFVRLVLRNVSKDLSSGTQRFVTHNFDPGPQERFDTSEESPKNCRFHVLAVGRLGLNRD